MKRSSIILSVVGIAAFVAVLVGTYFVGQYLVSNLDQQDSGVTDSDRAKQNSVRGRAGSSDKTDGESSSDVTPEDDKTSVRVWPIYIATMTHLEGTWTEAATNKAYFSKVANQMRYGMDVADEYGAILTFESEKPFAKGSATFKDNVLKEALDRGHGVGTHCDVGPKVDLGTQAIIKEFKDRKDLVDALVGAENNLGCSGGGGKSDWYAGAVGAGFSYLDGTVAFHYMALPQSERPTGWTDDAIQQEFFHDPAPQNESYYYPFLIKALGFSESAAGNLLITNGSIGDVRDLAEIQPLGLDSPDATCGDTCPFTDDDAKAAEAFIRDFVAKDDHSRPGKITFYFPTAAFDKKNEEALRTFFSTMKKLSDEGLVQWASQRQVYDAMMEYYRK